MRRAPRPLVLSFLSLALVAAACGDAGSASAVPDTTTSTVDDEPTSEPDAEVEDEAEDPTSTPSTTTPPSPTETNPDAPLVGGEPGDANVEELQRFLADGGDGDGPFYMVNMIRYRDTAEYPDGRETEFTGEEADALYGQFMRTTKLPEIGAEIVYVGEVERDVSGGSAFDRVAVVRYPSRAAFAAMSQDPEFQAMSVHKQAGVLDTVVLATTLIDAPQAPPLADPPFPATADDPSFAFMHVFDYRETAQYAEGDLDADPTRSGEEAVRLYSSNAGAVAAPLGVRAVAWFDVEATIIGPAGVWDEVRINSFPSHATFAELTDDATWRSGVHHRIAGLADTYAIMNLPRINEFSGLVAES